MTNPAACHKRAIMKRHLSPRGTRLRKGNYRKVNYPEREGHHRGDTEEQCLEGSLAERWESRNRKCGGSLRGGFLE